MTKREFKKLIGNSYIIELEYGVAKIALEKGWVTPCDNNFICHKKYSKRYYINLKMFSLNYMKLKNHPILEPVIVDYVDMFHSIETEMINELDASMARKLYEEIMNSFLNSTNTHLINFSKQINYHEEEK